MRILVLSNMYPPHHLGGYELSCRDVMDRFRERGHEITVLTTTMRLPGVDDPPDERTDRVRRDLTFYWVDHKLLSPSPWRRLAIERANQAALRSALEDARPDVVSVWNMGAMSLGLLTTLVELDIPIVFAVYDDWLVYGPLLDSWTRLFKGRPRLARFVQQRTGVPTTLPDMAAAGVYCFMSDYIRRTAVEKSGWTPLNSSVVYGGIDTNDFPPITPESRPWRGHLLSVGRIDERKGLHIALEALAQLQKDVTLEILGAGDARYGTRLEKLTKHLGLLDRVQFGVVPRDELRNRFAAADAFLFPVTWEEPFGLVPIEAMACGTPVIATGTGGSAEFLEHERNCLLIPRYDAGALAAAITRLALDTALRARLVEGGLQTAREFTIEKMTDALEAWHVAAAERFTRGRPPKRRSPATKTSGRDEGTS
jgi:glycosyltransferase involved in cell wall biosynthesis